MTKTHIKTFGLLIVLVVSLTAFLDTNQLADTNLDAYVAAATQASEKDGECSDPKSAAEKCNNKYVTNYIINGVPPKVVSCKLSPEFVTQICDGRADCQSYVDATIVEPLTNGGSNATAPAICDNGANYQYRGSVACFEGTYASNNTQVAAPIAALENWQCCRKDDPACSAQLTTAQGIVPTSIRRSLVERSYTPEISAPITSVGGGEVAGSKVAFTEDSSTNTFGGKRDTSAIFDFRERNQVGSFSGRNSLSDSSTQYSESQIISATAPGTQGTFSSLQITSLNRNPELFRQGNPPTRSASLGTPQVSGAGAEPLTTREGSTDEASSYKSLQSNSGGSVGTEQSRSSVQQFAWGTGLIDSLANFVRGRVVVNTVRTKVPETEKVSTIPTREIPETGREFRNIKEIASDIASKTQVEVSRVDNFAQTLSLVGGPNEVSTENKSFGRIQDLIIEDEAIRSLRLAEEEGKRAKNSTYCRAFETSKDCLERREARAKIVERQVFVAELEKRVLPENAILHFLAVYDGWVRPTPAPKTYATSTLGVLNTQEGTFLEEYEATTDGKSLVSRIIDSIADAASSAVETLTNLITGANTVFEEEAIN